jgi:hypothetical protein
VLPYVLLFGSDWHWRAWGEFMHSVETGKPAFEHVFGSLLFEYFAEHGEDAAEFDAAMTSRSRHEDPAVALAYDWPAGIIVDVGGGRGTQLTAILEKVPASRGMLFELPHVVDAAAKLIEERGWKSRCEVMAGDFFQEVPAGGDLYLLKKVIHNWDNDRASTILGNCRAAMRENSRLVLIELILPGPNEPSWSKLLDLQMLTLQRGGRERTEVEFKVLLTSARLTLSQIIPTPVGISIIEAVIA